MTKEAFKTLLEEVLTVAPGTLSENDTRKTLENWSSLVDVEILTVVSSEFGIDAELLEYESIGELLNLLEDQRVFSAA
jgi:acyl carrier protein